MSLFFKNSLALCLLLLFACSKRKPDTAPIQSEPVQVTPAPTNTVQTDTTQNTPQPIIGADIGNKAPDLNLMDTSKNYVRLSSLTDKYILVDFWASWCKPCRVENKNLMNVYSRYKDAAFKDASGFEIYSISTDSKTYPWKRQIMQDQYNWKYNVWDSTKWDETGVFQYKINFYPMNFLINPKGVIVAKNLRDSMVEKTLKLYVK